MQARQLTVAVALVCGLLPVIGQAPAPSTSAKDAALLAKANSGDAAAQVAVGECYADSKGVQRDYAQAAKWYRKAADKGDIRGELHLAGLYRDGGKNFPRDMVQAAEWYRKAAEQGDVGAQGTMGTLYSMGQGVQQNYAEAYYWLDLAAAVKGPKQEQYAANRQMIGMHITADELADVQDREAKWKAAHPR
jgi:TPR repeat protein